MKNYTSLSNRFFVVAALILVGLVFATGCNSRVADAQVDGTMPLTEEMLENGEYRSEWLQDDLAQLIDGEYRKPIVEGSATELVIRLVDTAFGDLDGDGVEDAVVILVTDPGGSGTFYDLAVVLNRDGNPEHIATASLGDRAKIQALSIGAGHIVVRMITHGPEDPMCCPTQEVEQTFALQEGELVQIASQVFSPVDGGSSDAITAEVGGIVWKWEGFENAAGETSIVVDDPNKYTLQLLPDGTYQVQADCNLSSGGYTLEGTNLVLLPGPTTLAECEPGSLFDEYMAGLGQVESFLLDGDKLVLNLQADAGSMLFSNGGTGVGISD
jgi:heat shock protein HslJ